jgi:hypothetical protein
LSCPALCRASTSCYPDSQQVVDGRDEPGHYFLMTDGVTAWLM